jgi:hypothetical protein
MKIRIVSTEPAIAGRIVEFFRFHKPLEGVTYEHFCPRAKILTPISRSSFAICLLTAGWEIPREAAAAEMLPFSITSTRL